MIGKSISHYRILEQIGAGGMGVVYKAEDSKLKRIVALKFLPSELTRDPEAKQRFIHEAQAASVLDHPNICTIHEIGETEDHQLFIVMSCYEGQTLEESIGSMQREVDKVLDIAIQIAKGLQEAHAKGIVHRDIKPANIMITEKDQIKIMDFGLAKLLGKTLLTKEGTTLGTVAYMSPEQTRGADVDHRTDLWALGVILYEMLTGERPFKGDYEQAVMYSILNEEPKAVTKVNPAVASEVEQIINKALKKAPESRYSSAAEMLKDLNHYRDSLQAEDLGECNLRTFLRRIGRPHVAIPIVGMMGIIILVAAWFFNRQAKIRWAREVVLPQIEKMIGENDVWRNLIPPYRLAEKAEAVLGNDPTLEELFSRCALNIDIRTEPTVAKIYIKDYEAPESDWSFLGISPL